MIRVSLGIIGLERLFGGDLSRLAHYVRRAEDQGVDMVSCTDHVIMGENLGKYPYGPFPMPLDWPWLEPVVLLSAIATVTQRVLLATGVIISPLRSAVLLAKQLATLDVLAGGRLRPGIGVGWQREEYDASNVAWDGRFGLMMEQVEVCRTLWGSAPASFKGKHIAFDRLYSVPHPLQGERMPIYFGIAPTDRNFERIASHGDGWIPMEQNPQRLTEAITRLRAAFRAHGRADSELHVRAVPSLRMGSSGHPDLDATLARVPEYLAAGATEIEVHPLNFCASPDDLDRLVERLVKLKA